MPPAYPNRRPSQSLPWNTWHREVRKRNQVINLEGHGGVERDGDSKVRKEGQVNEKGKRNGFPVVSDFRPIAESARPAITGVTCEGNNIISHRSLSPASENLGTEITFVAHG